jgi:hypothetical protein
MRLEHVCHGFAPSSGLHQVGPVASDSLRCDLSQSFPDIYPRTMESPVLFPQDSRMSLVGIGDESDAKHGLCLGRWTLVEVLDLRLDKDIDNIVVVVAHDLLFVSPLLVPSPTFLDMIPPPIPQIPLRSPPTDHPRNIVVELARFAGLTNAFLGTPMNCLRPFQPATTCKKTNSACQSCEALSCWFVLFVPDHSRFRF